MKHCMRILRGILIAGIMGSIGFIGWQHRAAVSPQALRTWIAQFGSAAPFVYILLYAANTVTVLPPIAVISLTAGLIFGPLMGFLVIMTGAMIGSAATFFIGRKLGRGFVEKRLKGKFKSLDEKLASRGFATVLFFRVIPLVPFEALNYASGLSKITFRHYWLATLLGLIPGAGVSAFFGDSLTQPISMKFIAAGTAMAVLVAIPVLYLKWKKKRAHDTD